MSPRFFRTRGEGGTESAIAPARTRDRARPHERMAQRAAAVRRRPWRLVAVLATVTALVAGVVFLLGFSRVFVAESVAVEGVDETMADGIVDAAQVPGGRPLARVDTTAIAERVLADTRLATAEVDRKWPSTIAIEVTRRTPAIALNRGKGEPVGLADAEGVVYEDVKKKPKDLPQVFIRGRDEVGAEAVQGALRVLEALPEDLEDDMRSLRIVDGTRLQFTLEPDIVVQWGSPDREELKIRVLQALLEQRELEHVREAEEGTAPKVTIDLTTPDAPVVSGLPDID